MAKVRNLLKDFKVEIAVGERKCHASEGHKIAKGEKHLALWATGVRQNICRACFRRMTNVAQAHWDEVVEELK